MTSAVAARHVPVLIDEVIVALAIAPGETHVDGTFGARRNCGWAGDG